MSKIKKAAAVVAASVLCMSMSLGVFASSPTDPEQIVNDGNTLTFNPIWGAAGTDKDGNKVTAYSMKELSQEVKEILSDDEKVKDILNQAGYTVKDGQDITVIAADDLSLVDGNFEETEMPEGGVDLEINLGSTSHFFDGTEEYTYTYGDIQGLEEGSTVYVLHQKADGTWEVLEGTVKVKSGENLYGGSWTDYYVTAHFDSLSPVAIIKVMSNGEVVVLDKEGTPTNTIEINPSNKGDKVKGDSVKVVKTTTVKKSPKTGN